MPDSDTDSNIRHLKLKKPTTPKNRIFHAVRNSSWRDGKACNHRDTTYLVDEARAEVECGRCKALLSPTWVLMILAEEESRWVQKQKEYLVVKAATENRKRTKCDHCGKMTNVSLNLSAETVHKIQIGVD